VPPPEIIQVTERIDVLVLISDDIAVTDDGYWLCCVVSTDKLMRLLAFENATEASQPERD